ncbi:hypothetical protein NOVO_04145 [Rickettsiales bacterium Ac37b]|nr:hypothetical protein NOVO_04145 [Rickettsiales bacterium Ac37b]
MAYNRNNSCYIAKVILGREFGISSDVSILGKILNFWNQSSNVKVSLVFLGTWDIINSNNYVNVKY